jgi:flagellar biosynthesis protein FlhB
VLQNLCQINDAAVVVVEYSKRTTFICTKDQLLETSDGIETSHDREEAVCDSNRLGGEQRMQNSEVLANYLKYKNVQKQKKLSLRWALGSLLLFLLLSSLAPFIDNSQPSLVSFGLSALIPSISLTNSTPLQYLVRIFKTSLIVFVVTSFAYYFFHSEISFQALNDKQLKLLGLNNSSTKLSTEEPQPTARQSFRLTLLC